MIIKRQPDHPVSMIGSPNKAANLCDRRRYALSQHGQAAIELAFLAPILALILVVAVDFGRLFYMNITLVNSARAGVQYGAQSTTTAADYNGMSQAALNDASNVPGVTASATNFCTCGGVSASCTSDCSDFRMYAQVTTSAVFHTLVTYPGVPSSIAVTRTASMRAE